MRVMYIFKVSEVVYELVNLQINRRLGQAGRQETRAGRQSGR